MQRSREENFFEKLSHQPSWRAYILLVKLVARTEASSSALRFRVLKKIFFVIGGGCVHTYSWGPSKIKGFVSFEGGFRLQKIFLHAPLRTHQDLWYNTHVLERGRGFGRVSGPWLTDRGTTKVNSTERGGNKLTKTKRKKTK